MDCRLNVRGFLNTLRRYQIGWIEREAAGMSMLIPSMFPTRLLFYHRCQKQPWCLHWIFTEKEKKEVLFDHNEKGKEKTLPSAETLTHVTAPRCPANVCISSPVCRSQTIKLQSFEPDITWLLLVTETATVKTASECPTNTFKQNHSHD